MAKTKASKAKVPAGILCSASVGKTQIGKVNYSELPPITQERWCSMKIIQHLILLEGGRR